MSQTLQNQVLMAKSMQGIVELSDGAGTTITNGTITTGNISGNTISGSSISTVGKSVMDSVITVATSASQYVWNYNQPQNIVFTGVETQDMFLPSVTTDNLGTTITIFKSTGTLNIQTQQTDPPEYIQTESNTQVEIYPISSLIQVVALTAISTTGSVWAVIYSQAPNTNIIATLGSVQTFTATKTFNANVNFISGKAVSANAQFTFNSTLPTSSLTPTTAQHLVTKIYLDGIVGRSNVWTNTNTFNTILPTSSLSPTSNNQFVIKSYVDGTVTPSLLPLNNSWSGINTFNNNLSMGSSGYFLPYYPTTNTSYRMGLNAMLYQTINSTNNLVWGSNAIQGVSAQGTNNQVRQGIYIGNNVGQGIYVIDGNMTTNHCDNNVIIGHNACSGQTFNMRNSVVLGANSGSGISLITDSVFIGTNIGTTGGFFADKCVVIGSGNCPSIVETSLSTVVGSSNALAGLANSSTIYGANNLTVGSANGSGVLIGSQNGENLATDAGAIIIGARSGNVLTDGFVNQIYGADSNIMISSRTNVSLHGSGITYFGPDNTFYVGGQWAGLYQDLVVTKKNRFLCNRTITTNNETLSEEDAEHIIIANNTVVNINLPTPTTANIGMRFTFVKSYSPPSLAYIVASTGLTILSSISNANSYGFGINRTFATLVCIATTGTAWVVVSDQPILTNYVTTNTNQTITGIKTFDAIVANQISSPNVGDTLNIIADVNINTGNFTVASGNYNTAGSGAITIGNSSSTISLNGTTTVNGITNVNYNFVIETGTTLNFNDNKYFGALVQFDSTSTTARTHIWLSPSTSAGAEISVVNNSSFTQTLNLSSGTLFSGPFGSNGLNQLVPVLTMFKMYSNGTNWIIYQSSILPQVYTRIHNTTQVMGNNTNVLVQFNTLGAGISANGPMTALSSTLTYNDVAGTFRFRNPTPIGGYYHIDVSLLFAPNATGVRLLWILPSNTTRYPQVIGNKSFPSTGASVLCHASTECELYLGLNESFQVFAYQTSGVSLSIQTQAFIQIRRI